LVIVLELVLTGVDNSPDVVGPHGARTVLVVSNLGKRQVVGSAAVTSLMQHAARNTFAAVAGQRRLRQRPIQPGRKYYSDKKSSDAQDRSRWLGKDIFSRRSASIAYGP
jgi:hypothetical protein